MIDAFERRAVGMDNVKDACLNAEMDEFLVLKLVDEQVDTMCKHALNVNSVFSNMVKRKSYV